MSDRASWRQVALGDVIELTSGQVDPREEPYASMFHVGGDNIKGNTGELAGLQKAGELGLISGKYVFDSRDILYSKIRPYLNKVATPDFQGICSADIYPLRPRKGIATREFVARLLKTNDFLRYTETCSSRTSIPKINRADLLRYRCVLPPLSEQKRIAAILDKADAIRRKRQEAIRLTEELLRSAFLEMFGDPVTNPKGWEVKPLGTVLDDVENGWSPICEARPASGDEWAVLKLGCVSYGRYDPTANKAMTVGLKPRADLEVKPGDLVFSRKNTFELVGATAFIFETPPRRTLPDTMFRLVLTDDCNPLYLWRLLSDPGIRERLRSQASGTAGSMPNISKQRLREIDVPLPPTHLQQKFSTIVHKLEAIRERASHAHRLHENLSDGLTSRAFAGTL